MERVWRFRIPCSLWILAWDLSFSSSHCSLILKILFFSASFSASYLYRQRALCSHPLQSAQPYTSKVCVYHSVLNKADFFTTVPAVRSYFFQNTPESILYIPSVVFRIVPVPHATVEVQVFFFLFRKRIRFPRCLRSS